MTLCHAAPTGPFTGQSGAGGAAVGGPSGREGEAQENGCAFLSNGPNLPLLRIAPLHPASCLHPNFHCPLLSWPQARPALPRGLGTDHPAPPFPGLGDSSPQTHTNLSDHPHPPPGFEPSPFSPPGPAPFSPLDLLSLLTPWTCSPFSPLNLLFLLTPGPALPSHPWTCSPFSPLDLLSPLTPWTCSPFSPPGPALPGGWVHPQGKMLPGLGPWSPGFGAHPGGPPGPPCTSLPGSIQPSCIPISSPPQSPPLTPTGLSALGEGLSAAMATASWLWSARQPPHCHRYGLFLIECLTLAQVVHLTYLMI